MKRTVQATNDEKKKKRENVIYFRLLMQVQAFVNDFLKDSHASMTSLPSTKTMPCFFP